MLICLLLKKPFLEWYWKCLISPWCWKCIAVITGIMSVAIVWSEVTFFSVSPPLSIFAVIVNAAKAGYDYFTIEVNTDWVIDIFDNCCFFLGFLYSYYPVPLILRLLYST